MLEELRIQNFAIIEDLVLRFAPDFNVITGETGAGKSIIIDAMGLLLGERADPGMLRGGAERALIEGVFVVPPQVGQVLQPLLEEHALEGDDPGVVILTREIRAGRSTARVNGVTVRVEVLREVGDLLVDIHGQSEHLSLLRPRQHIYLLDRYANLEEPREALAGVVGRLRQVRQEIAGLMRDEAETARRVDILTYQVEEIRAVDPSPDEEDEIRAERTRLANSERLAELSDQAYNWLLAGDDDSPAATDLLQQAAAALEKLAAIDPELNEQAEWAERLSAEAEELGESMRHYLEGVEFSPERIDELEERLEAISRIRRKYGGTVVAALDFLERAEAELDSIEHSEERLAELREQETDLLRSIGELAVKLSEARRKAGERLARNIVRELGDLRMEGAQFEVSLTRQPDPDHGAYVGAERFAFDATGIDTVEFLLSANPGEPVRPLHKVASGGETARIMLALKGVLGRVDHTPTLIFDEIDQGIGGRIGAVVGRKLWGLAESHQVLVVTHLAQLAGFADTHFRVSKAETGGRTVTHTDILDDRARVDELAEMLGAQTDSARQSAHDILMLARRTKEGARISD
ncbi:MAG: DNA repair protein RecN [Anaerolineae bacterium]|nr:DNA repair protein RecN [Anaerolineae bacterium]